MKSINQLYEEFNDNSKRQFVHQYIKNISYDQFEQSIDYFLEAFRNQKQEIKIFSMILFRNNYLEDNSNTKKLTQEICHYITQKLLEQMSLEDDKIFIKICLEVIVKLTTLNGQEYQLFQFLKYNPQNEKQIELQLLFIQSICSYSFNNQELEKNYEQLQNLLQIYFQQQNLQLICFETFILVLRNIDNDKMVGGFQQLIDKLIFFVEKKGQEGIQAMILFNEFIDKEYRAPKDGFEPLLNFYWNLLKNSSEPELIIQTMNGLRIVAERLGAHMIQYYLTSVLTQQLMDMISLIQDQEIITLSQNDISTIAAETLQEFVQWLGPQYVYSILKSKILVVLEDENWKLQHSGLSAVYAIAQEITQQIDEFSSEELMNYIVPLQNSSNLVIINDILQIYGWFCFLYKPDLQYNEAEEMFEFLSNCFKNPLKEIQEKAIVTLKIYIENSCEDAGVVGKLIDNQEVLIQNLLRLMINDIRNPQFFMQIANVLNLFASTLQENLKEDFYFQIKKIMTLVLQEIPYDTFIYQEIRTSAIESLGTLIFSINSNIELLRQEAFPTLNMMLQLYEKYTYDDPHQTAILYFIGQIAASTKDQFFHYHKTVFPLIFKAANLEVQNQLPPQKMEEEINFNHLMEIENNKQLELKIKNENQEDLLNQIQLNKKLEAFKCIKQILQYAGGSLKKQFKDQVLELFIQYLPYNIVKDIRNSNAEILKVLLFTTDNNIDMAEIFNTAYPHLNNIIQLKVESSDIQDLCYFFNILNSCLKQFRNQLVNAGELSKTLLYASKSLSIYEKNFQKIEEKYTHIYDKEKKENEENQLTDILDEVTSFSGYVLEFHTSQFENLICNNIAYLFCQILQTEFPLTKQVNVACCFCCYAFEYLSDDIFQIFTKKIFKYFLSHGTKSQDVDIQQNICFGIGLVSRRMDPNSYKECRQVCLTFLDFILEHKQAHTEKRMAITEIAIASLGKVALFQCHQDPKLREKLINKFLSSLPLKHEPEDSQELHQLLIDQIIQKNPAFLNCSPQTFKKLQSTVKSIRKYHEDHPELEILTDDAYYQIGSLDFSQLQSQIP